MTVEFGVLIPTREAIMSGRPQTGPLLAMAERAEAAGFDSVWIGDSITARPRHEPLTLMAALAARTRRVRLGTGVLLPALRNPVVLAHVVGTLDRVAEGRVILGVGFAADTPAIRKEFAATGVPFERRVGRFLETLEICRALWSRDNVSFSGKHFTLNGVSVEPKPHRAGGPPIWVGGSGPTAFRRGRALRRVVSDRTERGVLRRALPWHPGGGASGRTPGWRRRGCGRSRWRSTPIAQPPRRAWISSSRRTTRRRARKIKARQAGYAGPLEGCVEVGPALDRRRCAASGAALRGRRSACAGRRGRLAAAALDSHARPSHHRIAGRRRT